MESLDYLDRLTYELGYKADGSGVLQNELISPYHLKIGRKRSTRPVTVYLKSDQSFVGDFQSVTAACKALRINFTSGYSCLNDQHYAGYGKYRFLPQGEPYRPIPKRPRKRRPTGNFHPNAKSCWVYTKCGKFLGEFGSYNEASAKFAIDRFSIKRMISGQLYSSGNYCIRSVGQDWEPPKHKTRPVKEVIGYNPDGQLIHFSKLIDATVEVFGKRSGNGQILKSIKSPITKKICVRGWTFFCGSENVPSYNEIVFADRRSK